MMKRRLVITLLVAVTTAVQAQETAQRWHETIAPVRGYQPNARSIGTDKSASFFILLTTDTFADVAVGRGGTLSDQVRSFRLLIEQSDAPEIFRDLCRRGTTAGKLYGLCGLWLKDQTAFKTEFATLSQAKGDVRTMFGCVVSKDPIQEILKRTDGNVVRLKRGQSLEDWFAKGKTDGIKGYSLDIYGGGYPMWFAATRRQ